MLLRVCVYQVIASIIIVHISPVIFVVYLKLIKGNSHLVLLRPSYLELCWKVHLLLRVDLVLRAVKGCLKHNLRLREINVNFNLLNSRDVLHVQNKSTRLIDSVVKAKVIDQVWSIVIFEPMFINRHPHFFDILTVVILKEDNKDSQLRVKQSIVYAPEFYC